MTRHGMPTSAVAREFATFAGLIGDGLRRPIVKSVQKWQDTPAVLRRLYGDRYDLQRLLLAFERSGFQLDASDPLAVRTAGFIAGVNRMAARLDDPGRRRLVRRVLGDLAPGQDIRHLEFEIRVFHHLERKGLAFRMADQEGLGDFDFLVDPDGGPVEVECKTTAGTTGGDLKDEDQVLLGKIFLKRCRKPLVPAESGLFVLTLKWPRREVIDLAGLVTASFKAWRGEVVASDALELAWEPRPAWQALFDQHDEAGLRAAIAGDGAITRGFALGTPAGGHYMALTVRSSRPPSYGCSRNLT